VVKHDNKERAIKAKQAWMHNELKETSFKKMNRSEFISLMDEEQAYYQGINPSGEISGTSSVVYDGEEIKPDEMLHFSIESANVKNEESTQKAIKKLTEEYKETSWARAKHVVFDADHKKNVKYNGKSLFERLSSFIPLRRITIPMTCSEEWNRNLDS